MNWLDLCRGRPCIACGADDGTIVPAHRNEGKGMGIKSLDAFCVPLCLQCHTAYDNGQIWDRESKREFWRTCWFMHMFALCEAGLVTPLGHKERERRPVRLAKTVDRNPPPWRPAA